jgi:hypothetical protein
MSQIFWRDRHDKLFRISEMTDQYLRNAIKFFKRTGQREEELDAMRLELQYRKQLKKKNKEYE